MIPDFDRLRDLNKARHRLVRVMADARDYLNSADSEAEVLLHFGRCCHKWGMFWHYVMVWASINDDENWLPDYRRINTLASRFYMLMDELNEEKEMAPLSQLIKERMPKLASAMVRILCHPVRTKHMVYPTRLLELQDMVREMRSTWKISEHGYDDSDGKELPLFSLECGGLDENDRPNYLDGDDLTELKLASRAKICNSRMLRQYEYLPQKLEPARNMWDLTKYSQQRFSANCRLVQSTFERRIHATRQNSRTIGTNQTRRTG